MLFVRFVEQNLLIGALIKKWLW